MNALVVDRASVRSHIRGNRRASATESHDIRVARHVKEDVVVAVVRCPVQVDPNVGVIGDVRDGQVRRNVVRVLTDVGKGENVPNVLCIGLRIDRIYLYPRDARARIDHRQTLQGVVVFVPEVLGEEIVAVRLVIVCPNVKLLGLGAPLHFNFLALTLLLAEHRGIVDLAPLGFQLGSKQGLTALDQGTLKRHADVARLNVLQDVVFLTLETDVHLVFKVKCGFRVVVGSKVDFVANAAVDGQLYALVKVERRDRTVPLCKARVFRSAVTHTKVQFGRTLRLDFNFV